MNAALKINSTLKNKFLHVKIGVIKMVQLAKSSSSALSAPTNVAASLCS